MKKQTITAIIPAKNEEKNIGRCLKSLMWCDKVQVLWMGDDQTGAIAKKLGAEVVELKRSDKSDFSAVQENINWAIDQATTDWLLRVDADEVVTPQLKVEIEQILVSGSQYVAFGIPRRQYFLGTFLTGGDWAYDRLVRLFRPQSARYEPLVAVHEQLKVRGKIGYLYSHLLHFSHPNIATIIKKFDFYTTLEAKESSDSAILALTKMLFLPPYIFLRWFIWHHGYRDGVKGVIAGAFRAWYDWLLYWKCLEKQLKIRN